VAPRRYALLVAAGLALLVLELAGLRAQARDALPWFVALALAQGGVYFVAVWWVSSGRPAPLALVLGAAVVLRLPLLLSPPSLSTDIYRYVWDGRVQAAGTNPYRFVPAAPELAALRDDRIYPHINRREYAVTIYPPAAQASFLAVTRVSESVLWMKTSVLAFEGLAIWLLLRLLRRSGRPEPEVLLYAWHPLALWEFAGSGHLDAAPMALVLAALLGTARGKSALSGLALGVATLFKLYPVVVLPALWRRGDWRMPLAFAGTVALGYLPYASVGTGVLGFLPGYAREEGLLTGSPYFLLQMADSVAGRELPAWLYLIPAVLVLIGLSIWAVRQEGERAREKAALALGAAAMIAVSPHYAWYFAWLLPLAALTRCLPMLLLGVTSFVLYVSLLWDSPSTRLWSNAGVYLPALALLLVLWSQHRRPAGDAAGARA